MVIAYDPSRSALYSPESRDTVFQNGADGFGSLRARDGRVLLALRGTQPDDLRDIKHDLGVRMVG